MTTAIVSPLPQFFDNDGKPLSSGYIYVGIVSQNPETAPQAVYWDSALTQPAAQPLRTLNGIIVRNGTAGQVYVASDYSLTVKNALGVLINYVPTSIFYNVGQQLSQLSTDLASSTDAAKGPALVGYGPGLAYPVTSVGAALSAHGRILLGVDRTGVTDCTAAMLAFFDACIPTGLRAVLPSGTYLVSGPISNAATIAAGGLQIECIGDVTINVAPAAATFTTLLSCQTTAINSSVIKGGRLTIDLSNRCANAIYLRHYGVDGGSVNWSPITVLNAKENAATTNENQALFIYGRYTSVVLSQPTVTGVTRVTAGGACKGISINDIVGEVRVVGPRISGVLTGGGTADADALSIFGYQLNGVYGRRAGRAVVEGGVYTDNQGRSIKLQVSEALIDRPEIRRKMVVSISTADIDVQIGGSVEIRSPVFDYQKNAGVSPLDAGFYPISLQQQCTDSPNDLVVSNPLLRTEVAMPRLVYLTIGASAAIGRVQVEGTRVQALGALAGSAFSRTLLEFHAGQVAASSNLTHISVRGTRADLSGVPVLGNTDFGASVAAKLSVDVVGNENTGAVAALTRTLGTISGGAIPALLRFMYRDNPGINDFIALTSFDYAVLPVGCRFHYNAATVTASNGPPLGGVGIAFVEVLGQVNETAGSRSIRVLKDNASVANTVYYTQTGTWGLIK